MLRVYLETSFVSACVTTKEDEASRDQRWRSLAWWHRHRDDVSAWGSSEVMRELLAEDYRDRLAALRFVAGLPIVSPDAEVGRIADALRAERLVPRGDLGDALHAALAIRHRMDRLLSWDARHLAHPGKRRGLERVCRRLGYPAPWFLTPVAWEGRGG
ncbi:MAG: PIN domain-containing protein [Planctomycetes bacterium]|nr:PIN domain-containing protein [Planctomycetota bacterium]